MHPGVLECAVIGVPDTASGEAVKAFVVRRDPALTEDELKKFAAEQLTNYKRPKFIEFRDELPKTNVGKILRRAARRVDEAEGGVGLRPSFETAALRPPQDEDLMVRSRPKVGVSNHGPRNVLNRS